MKINKLLPDQAEYTKLLPDIDKSIKSLYFIGNIPEKRHPTVAIVGTRKPTPYGKEIAHQIAGELAQQGVIIVSGLAYGIDAIAHAAALEAGGTTIAVLPTSIDKIYPAAHQKLAERIVQSGGALITEYENGATAYKSNFIARNRIVSGISDGVLIIEAAARSGTTTTASFAIEQGKAVMAVPGNITNPMSAGCNNLIKTGARLVTDTQDVLDEIGVDLRTNQAELPLAFSAEEQVILSLLADGLRDGEELQKQSQLDAVSFGTTLTALEIQGKIRALGGGQWAIR